MSFLINSAKFYWIFKEKNVNSFKCHEDLSSKWEQENLNMVILKLYIQNLEKKLEQLTVMCHVYILMKSFEKYILKF